MKYVRYGGAGFLLMLVCITSALSVYAAEGPTTSLLGSTLIGGAEDSDNPYSLALDNAGNVYVAGYTRSCDFPATEGGYSTTCAGSYDAFIAKFDSDLKTLIASTYYGGEGSDEVRAITIDGTGNIYIAGITGSDDLPTTPDAFQPSHRVGRVGTDGFIACFDADLQTLLAATYLSGSDGGAEDRCYAVDVSSAGNVYALGYTDAPNFPVTPGAYDTDHGADPDAINPGGKLFVSKLDAGLHNMQAGTFLGTTDGGESAYAIIVDEAERIYVAGHTGASDFPVTEGAYDTILNDGSGGSDIFIARFNADLSSLEVCSFLGGSDSDTLGYDRPQQTDKSIALDAAGNVYVTGTTYSLDFPVTSGAFSSVREYGGTFVSKFDPDLSRLLASTYLCNGSSRSVALDSGGNVCVAGDSEYGCPVPQNAYQTQEDQWGSVYVIRLDSMLKKMLSATFLGGSERETALSITVDAADNIYLTGKTASPDFPVTAEAYDTSFNSAEDDYDGFVVKFDRDLAGGQTDVPPGADCPFETAVNDARLLNVLRIIRNNTSARSIAKGCVAEYYRHADELSSILAANPQMRRDVHALVTANWRQLAAYAERGEAFITNKTAAAVTAFLERLKAKASPDLACCIEGWLRMMTDNGFLSSMGIAVTEPLKGLPVAGNLR